MFLVLDSGFSDHDVKLNLILVWKYKVRFMNNKKVIHCNKHISNKYNKKNLFA